MTANALSSFGVSEFTTWPWSFEQDVRRYADAGIAAIEVCEFKLNKEDYSEQLASISLAGLTVSSVQSTVHSIFPDSLAAQPTAPEDRIRHIVQAMERIAPHVPPGTPFVVITGAAPNQDTALVIDRCTSALAQLAEQAQRHGVRVAFEPLNPVLFNTDTALWGLGRARELVERVAHPALGLCVDTWNVFETPNLLQEVAHARERIFLVQISQWRQPRSGADRRNLGEGGIDNVSIMRALRAAGYRGPYVLEIFSGESLPDSIWRSDLEAVLRANRDVFRLLWEQSGA